MLVMAMIMNNKIRQGCFTDIYMHLPSMYIQPNVLYNDIYLAPSAYFRGDGLLE